MDEAAKADLKKSKGQYYRKLYQLAEVATFTPSMAAGAEAEQGSQQDLVEHTLTGGRQPGQVCRGRQGRRPVAQAVKGKEHQGIVLTGTVKSTRQSGQVFETQLLLTDGQNVVTVLSPAAPPVGPQGAVLVWGTVADDPAQKHRRLRRGRTDRGLDPRRRSGCGCRQSRQRPLRSVTGAARAQGNG